MREGQILWKAAPRPTHKQCLTILLFISQYCDMCNVAMSWSLKKNASTFGTSLGAEPSGCASKTFAPLSDEKVEMIQELREDMEWYGNKWEIKKKKTYNTTTVESSKTFKPLYIEIMWYSHSWMLKSFRFYFLEIDHLSLFFFPRPHFSNRFRTENECCWTQATTKTT